jgi:FKBP-type peptidyl-prolyl cis-trans isomerase (trigger factor)
MAKVDIQKPAQRYSIDRRPDGTIVIKVTVPAKDAERVREEIINELAKRVEIPGFRKGAAPRKLAEEKLNPEAVREETLKKILTDEYVAAIKDLNINPIVNPRIHVEQFAEGTDLIFEAETCEAPVVDLKNYKSEVAKIKPTPKIIIPGQEEKKDEPQKKLDEILAAILNIAEIKIPKILIDQETNRLLSQLLDEIKRLGVSLDQYLAARNKTEADLRHEYEDRAEKDLKLEFLLRKIADEEKITVEQKEIDEAVAAVKDEKQKKDIAQNPYLVAAIIRQQKTLSYLSGL